MADPNNAPPGDGFYWAPIIAEAALDVGDYGVVTEYEIALLEAIEDTNYLEANHYASDELAAWKIVYKVENLAEVKRSLNPSMNGQLQFENNGEGSGDYSTDNGCSASSGNGPVDLLPNGTTECWETYIVPKDSEWAYWVWWDYVSDGKGNYIEVSVVFRIY
jgi:hypothetical protein